MINPFNDRSCYCVLYYLEKYCGEELANLIKEKGVVGLNGVGCFGQPIATFTWKDNVPIFEFIDPIPLNRNNFFPEQYRLEQDKCLKS